MKIIMQNRIHRNALFFFHSSTEMYHSFYVIYLNTVNIWKIYLYSIIRYWHHRKLAMGRWIKNWALNQNGRNVWFRVSCFVILYHNKLKISLICVSHVYINLKTRFLVIKVNMMRYYTLSHTFLQFCFRTIFFSDCLQIYRYASDESMNTHDIPIDSQFIDVCHRSCRKF